ncbi:MAG: LacI family DNA-binding transcriptional regulator [Cyclobacteriaceae bacterium]
MPKNRGVTIYDIAKHLKLSPSSVSRALKDHPSIGAKTKEKVKKYAAKMGYRPNNIAASLRNNKTGTIGAILPRMDRPFSSSLISGIEQVANAERYNVIFSQSHDNYEMEVKNAGALFASRVEGLIVSLCVDTIDFSHFAQFVEQDIPVVLVDRVTNQLNCDLVMIDNFKAAFDATEHLITQGCKRIAHVTGKASSMLYSNRIRGYKAALEKYGVQFNEEYLIHNSLSAEDGHLAANQLFGLSEPPDGVFVANDTAAVSVIQNAKSKQIKVPDELAVIGFNNDPVCMIIDPALSTIAHPAVDMGKISAEQVFKKKSFDAGIVAPEKLILSTELIVRSSSLRI